ncbi:Alpha/beta hydrolase family protein [Symmachiella macrocystis]|uniref:Alpha/beta hydrolase family protein n=1 Tax=Symmachiella macrocystis TaxID=2527985 RepID=A0A5C6BRJ0_9PLAN|nr:alpha/beta fold hydrolase [Symmachiella macrocystis]TWU14863.1 Alpha/beta hydrolase family protein [Symmachiella macrocystis]
MFQRDIRRTNASISSMKTSRATLLALICLATPLSAAAAEPRTNPATTEQTWRPNLKLKTMGGVQFWSDVHFFHGWHVQQHSSTGHCRLLDADDVRHAWGSREECFAALEIIKNKQKIPPKPGRTAILVHGIVRSARSMNAIRKRLEADGFQVIGFNYASTRIDISSAADYLQQVVESLDGVEEINFVVHSMGGLVVRSYLSKHRDKRIKRLVMLGVPNLGAKLAKDLKHNWLYKTVWGPAGQQLAKDPNGFIAGLPTPDFEFAVIAGSRGTLDGYNPLLPGDDDGTVAVENTRLPGATDFIAVQSLHSFLMYDSAVLDYTLRFLTEGRLRAEGERHPIPQKQAAADAAKS